MRDHYFPLEFMYAEGSYSSHSDVLLRHVRGKSEQLADDEGRLVAAAAGWFAVLPYSETRQARRNTFSVLAKHSAKPGRTIKFYIL